MNKVEELHDRVMDTMVDGIQNNKGIVRKCVRCGREYMVYDQKLQKNMKYTCKICRNSLTLNF